MPRSRGWGHLDPDRKTHFLKGQRSLDLALNE